MYVLNKITKEYFNLSFKKKRKKHYIQFKKISKMSYNSFKISQLHERKESKGKGKTPKDSKSG